MEFIKRRKRDCVVKKEDSNNSESLGINIFYICSIPGRIKFEKKSDMEGTFDFKLNWYPCYLRLELVF